MYLIAMVETTRHKSPMSSLIEHDQLFVTLLAPWVMTLVNKMRGLSPWNVVSHFIPNRRLMAKTEKQCHQMFSS